MANFRSAHPGHTRKVLQHPLPGQQPGPGKARHKPAHPVAAPVATNSAADVAAMAIYVWQGKFDRIKLREGFIKEFGKDPHFDTSAIPHMELLLGFIESDIRITDIRWMAYMLATAYWETTSLKKETVPTLDIGLDRLALLGSATQKGLRGLYRVDLPGGGSFNGPADLISLVRNDPALPGCIAQKAFTYGMSRGPRPSDRVPLDGIVSSFASHGYRFSDLVRLIVTSEPFSRR